ncbi:MAG: bifunctional metallophosphatase/5'-nucleotidase [Muribaculaceae bacterium]|nr:bifunctional metallophosphatase/5'-nucleotidase [Muribaculaceae bacterium]
MLAATVAAAGLCCQAEKLVILHTNDTHSQIDPDAETGLGGVARRQVVIDSVRAEHPDETLIIDLGDVVQGSLFFNLYRGEVEEKLMNALGYDLRILGNHEFDNGMQALADNLAEAEALRLCANYNTVDTPLEGVFIPWAVHYGGKKIAFMPINLQPKGMISARNVEGMGYADAVEAANNMAWYLKNIENFDYVVALTHIGYAADTALIHRSTDIDLLLGGHSHTLIDPANPKSVPHVVKNAEGRDVVVAQAGRKGLYVGEVVIDIDNLDALPQSRLIPIDSRLDDRINPVIEEIIAPYRAEVDALNSNYIARTAAAMPKDSHELLNFVADFVDWRGRQLTEGVDLAIVNKGGIRNSLPKGKVAQGQLITMLPFFNKIQVIELPGSQLIKAFDVMAAAGGNGVSGNVQAIFDPATNKCVEITISGQQIDPNKTYRLATIDYLAEGGDYMQPLVDHTLVAESPTYMFEDIATYFLSGPGKGKAVKSSGKARMAPVSK